MTRNGDEFVSLADRVKIARDANAALLISIHADTLQAAADVSGATVYTVADRASDAEAARIAERENAADRAAGVEQKEEAVGVADILFDLKRRETRAYAHLFSRGVVDQWRSVGSAQSQPRALRRLHGSEGARFPVGPDRTRLSLEPAGREILDIGGMAGQGDVGARRARSIASSRRGPMRNARRPKPRRARAPPRLASRARIELAAGVINRSRRSTGRAIGGCVGRVGPNSPRPRHKLILRRFYLCGSGAASASNRKATSDRIWLKHAADRPFSRLPLCDLRDGLRRSSRPASRRSYGNTSRTFPTTPSFRTTSRR